MIRRLLRALRRALSRPTRAVDRGEWVEVSVALSAWHGPPVKAGQACWFDASTGVWSVYDLGPSDAIASRHVEVVKPTELDAIAARFDARVDAAIAAKEQAK